MHASIDRSTDLPPNEPDGLRMQRLHFRAPVRRFRRARRSRVPHPAGHLPLRHLPARVVFRARRQAYVQPFNQRKELGKQLFPLYDDTCAD